MPLDQMTAGVTGGHLIRQFLTLSNTDSVGRVKLSFPLMR